MEYVPKNKKRMKIAVICGVPNFNTGMMFVDRALYYYLKKVNLLDQTTFYCFELEGFNKVGFSYLPLSKNVDLRDYDRVVIWGDFMISQHFMAMTQPKMEKKSPLFLYDIQSKLLMETFTDKEIAEKVIVIGQCITVDGFEIFSNEKYLSLFRRIIRNARLFKVRDPLSAYKAKVLSKTKKDYVGLDTALFNYYLDTKKISEIKNEANSMKNDKKEVGIFFARSKNFNRKKKVLGYYMKYKMKNYDFKWIPWLENKQESKTFFPFAKECTPVSDIDYIREILSSDFIITDTYHLSLMSWSLGVPCICFGNGNEIFRTTLHDKKKEIFFISNYIDEYYLFNETFDFIRNLKNGIIVKRIEEAFNSGIAEIVSENIRNMAEICLEELDDALL